MRGAFSKLLSEVQQICPQATGEVIAADSGSALRPHLRQSLKKLPNLTAGDVSRLDDLSKPPRLTHWSVSISHTANVGAWLAVPRPLQIGFDLERMERIQPGIIRRVCSIPEIATAPEPLFLWPAKEALYKALEDDQPETLSQLSISDWASQGEVWWWRGVGHPARGFAFLEDKFVFSACLISRMH